MPKLIDEDYINQKKKRDEDCITRVATPLLFPQLVSSNRYEGLTILSLSLLRRTRLLLYLLSFSALFD